MMLVEILQGQLKMVWLGLLLIELFWKPMKGNTFIYQSRLQIYYKMADVNKKRKYLVHAKYRKQVSNDEHKTTLTNSHF